MGSRSQREASGGQIPSATAAETSSGAGEEPPSLGAGLSLSSLD